MGLVTFDEKICDSLPPKSKRQQIGNILSLLAKLQPRAKTDIARSLNQLAAMLKHSSLVMLFSDLLADPEPVLAALRRLRHGGHDVIVFHILDQAEVQFPFEGLVELIEPETQDKMEVDADGYRRDYLEEIEKFRTTLPAGMPAKPHRLRAAGHEHAVRPGADGIPGEPPQLGVRPRDDRRLRGFRGWDSAGGRAGRMDGRWN